VLPLFFAAMTVPSGNNSIRFTAPPPGGRFANGVHVPTAITRDAASNIPNRTSQNPGVLDRNMRSLLTWRMCIVFIVSFGVKVGTEGDFAL